MSYLGGRRIYIDSDGNEHFDYERDYEPKPITNYDRIISKTPEELAVWLPLCDHVMGQRTCHKDGCEKCWLEWLKEGVRDV